MSIANKIEKYVGRKVDFKTEVLLMDEGDGVFIFKWNIDFPQPSTEELNNIDTTAIDSLQAVQDNRAAAYPSIADQLDTLYHGGYDAWKATITAVKEEFPKP